MSISKKNFIALIIIIIIFGYSCSNRTSVKKVNNESIITIDLDNIKFVDKLKLSSIFSKVIPIVLETNENSLIGNINKMQAIENFIVILDNTNANSVYVFDNKGNFIRKIGEKGMGPGEFIAPTDFTVDNKNKWIYILDSRSQKINKYDINTGIYISSIKLDKSNYRWHIQYFNDALYVTNGRFNDTQKKFMLSKIDVNTGNIVENYFDLEQYGKNVDFLTNNNKSPFLFCNNELMRYNTYFMDTVFSISENLITPFLTFSKKDLIAKEELKDFNINQVNSMNEIISKNKVYNIFFYSENKNNLFLDFFKGRQGCTVFYDINNNSLMSIGLLLDNLFYQEKFESIAFPNFISNDSNGIYFLLSPEEFFRNKNMLSEEFLNNNELSSVQEDSNPIILYYEYKN